MLTFKRFNKKLKQKFEAKSPSQDLIDNISESIYDGDLKYVKDNYLDKGYDVNFKIGYDATLLILACYANQRKMVKLLLDYGADPNLQCGNDDSITPLIQAIYNENSEIVKLLLDAGADPDKVDNEGDAPLVVACLEGYSEIVKLLLDAGADPDIKDKFGRTPLRVSKYSPEIMKLLSIYSD